MEASSSTRAATHVLVFIALLISLGMAKPIARDTFPVPASANRCPVPNSLFERPPFLSTADFVVTATGGQQWVVNGSANPSLTLTRGQTYTFDLTAFLDEHPFLINSNASNPWGIIFLPAAYGQVVSFTPDFQMPNSIYYHCEVHYGGMAGVINLVQPTCPSDVNGDGQVNVSDFLALNSAYNTACGLCAADIDHNGVVNVSDFLALNSDYDSPCGD